MRTFISIEIPEEIKNEIEKIQKKLPEFNGKLTERENLHLTLKFFGEIDEDQIREIKKRLDKFKFNSFEAEINSIGFFSKKFVKIIWLSIKNCDAIQKNIDNQIIELFKPEKRFMGHLTIARIKNIKDKKLFIKELTKIKISPIKFQVKSFELKKSNLTKQGPIYETIQKYSLKI